MDRFGDARDILTRVHALRIEALNKEPSIKLERDYAVLLHYDVYVRLMVGTSAHGDGVNMQRKTIMGLPYYVHPGGYGISKDLLRLLRKEDAAAIVAEFKG